MEAWPAFVGKEPEIDALRTFTIGKGEDGDLAALSIC